MKKLLQEFKAFALRGNVMDMAVGIIIGSAFGKIVTSLVTDLIMPPIGLLVGGVDFKDLRVLLQPAAVDAATGAAVPAVMINYGSFLQIVFDFLIIAFCIFLMVKTLSKLKKKEAPAPPPEVSQDVQLLTEIRDLLKQQAQHK